MKKCTVCGEYKPLSNFYNRVASEDGKAYRCKACDNLAGANYRELHRERYLSNQRISNRKCKYNLSEDSFTKLKIEQDNKCAICKVKLQENATNKHTSETLCIDHCHKTGKIRGLLCTRCNKALGLLDDNTAFLKTAILYLEKNN